MNPAHNSRESTHGRLRACNTKFFLSAAHTTRKLALLRNTSTPHGIYFVAMNIELESRAAEAKDQHPGVLPSVARQGHEDLEGDRRDRFPDQESLGEQRLHEREITKKAGCYISNSSRIFIHFF